MVIQFPTEVKREGASPISAVSFGPLSPQPVFSFHTADEDVLSPAVDSPHLATVNGSVVNINSILNSKVKIQPKPSDKIPTQTVKKTLSQNGELISFMSFFLSKMF